MFPCKALLTLVLFKVIYGGIHIRQIQENPGIYFEEIGRAEFFSSEWKVVIYYDLTVLKQALIHTSRYVNEINKLCTSLQGDENFEIVCNSTVHEMNHLMNDINHKFDLIKTNKRSKRALFDAIGIVSKSLFGTLNDEDAKFYDRQIEKLQYNENHLLSLVKNQTLLIDTTANIFNKTQHHIESQISVLNTKFSKLKVMIDDLTNLKRDQQVYFEMESLTSLTTLIIIRYQNAISTIVDLVTDVRHGKPHPAIISPNQLQSILDTIRKEIASDIRLPSSLNDNSILPLYQVSAMSTTVLNDKIIYELKIPLPHKENYQLYKVIPFPTKFQNKLVFIQPKTNYLVIDNTREHYYDLSSEELANCITQDHSQFLCREIHPLFSATSHSHFCEVHLLRRENISPLDCQISQTNLSIVWIQLSQTNKWLFSTLENYTIDEICHDIITPYTLQGSGLLEISSDCFLLTKDLTIRGHNTKLSVIKNSYIPPLNISDLLVKVNQTTPKTPDSAFFKFTNDNDLAKLSLKIHEMKESEKIGLKPLDKHDVHHYTVIYIIALILLVMLTYKYYEIFTDKITKCMQKPPVGNETNEQRNNAEDGPKFVLTCGSK